MLARERNLDAVRFWAAMTVLWSHAVPLTQGSERNELTFRLSRGETTTGTLAVFAFFALSGYLITRSFERARTPWHFVRARVLRIMPALIVLLLLMAFVLGPLASDVPWQRYFASPDPYRYVRLQGTLFFGWFDSLPGVFTDHPMRQINGSIWTLRYEAECYGLVFLLGIGGLLRKEVTLALYVAVMVALTIFPGAPGGDGVPADPNAHLDLGAGFLAGALIHQWKLPLDGRIALLGVAGTLALMFSGEVLIAQRTLIPYLTLYVALSPSVGRIPYPWPSKDVSYGLYIWAWPVCQLVIDVLDQPRWWQVAALATPLVLAAGWLSWTLVEERALRLKDSPLLGASAPESEATQRHAHG